MAINQVQVVAHGIWTHRRDYGRCTAVGMWRCGASAATTWQRTVTVSLSVGAFGTPYRGIHLTGELCTNTNITEEESGGMRSGIM